jgi:RecA-family ATPase
MEKQTAMGAGAPGTGKSFAIMDMLARVSCGLPFMGKPTLAGGTIYVTGEGQSGISKRVAAIAGRFSELQAAPFIYLNVMPRLLEPNQVRDFIEAIKIGTDKWTVPTRIIAFDTFNRAIVGGSENEGKDVAQLLDADNQIKEALGCATIYAHHPGKADGNNMRGHSSLLGDTDVMATFEGRTGTRTIEIKKQKDEVDGGVFGYSLCPADLGQHIKSGDLVTSCLVDWVDSETVRGLRANKADCFRCTGLSRYHRLSRAWEQVVPGSRSASRRGEWH